MIYQKIPCWSCFNVFTIQFTVQCTVQCTLQCAVQCTSREQPDTSGAPLYKSTFGTWNTAGPHLVYTPSAHQDTSENIWNTVGHIWTHLVYRIMHTQCVVQGYIPVYNAVCIPVYICVLPILCAVESTVKCISQVQPCVHFSIQSTIHSCNPVYSPIYSSVCSPIYTSICLVYSQMYIQYKVQCMLRVFVLVFSMSIKSYEWLLQSFLQKMAKNEQSIGSKKERKKEENFSDLKTGQLDTECRPVVCQFSCSTPHKQRLKHQEFLLLIVKSFVA